MRCGLKGGQLLALLGAAISLGAAQQAVQIDMQSYETTATMSCPFKAWSWGGRDLSLDFDCGGRKVSFEKRDKILTYLEKNARPPVACAFKLGSIAGDEVIDCDF